MRGMHLHVDLTKDGQVAVRFIHGLRTYKSTVASAQSFPSKIVQFHAQYETPHSIHLVASQPSPGIVGIADSCTIFRLRKVDL